eukprot:COSAG02_NODE_2469_length_8749_cov_4.425202_2_plen_167_part_00
MATPTMSSAISSCCHRHNVIGRATHRVSENRTLTKISQDSGQRLTSFMILSVTESDNQLGRTGIQELTDSKRRNDHLKTRARPSTCIYLYNVASVIASFRPLTARPCSEWGYAQRQQLICRWLYSQITPRSVVSVAWRPPGDVAFGSCLCLLLQQVALSFSRSQPS